MIYSTSSKLNNNELYKMNIINNNSINNNNYIYCYIISILALLIIFPLLYLDIYQNGIVIVNYFNNI